jgi:exodeoxyribonuclease V gamma subunit
LDTGSYIGIKELELTLGDFHVTGRFELWENGLFVRRFAKAKANDEIALWIYHLAFNAARQNWPDSASIRKAQSTFLARNGTLRFKEVDEPEGFLSRLLDIYWSGLRLPVAFFPEASLRFCRKISNGASHEEALRAAEGVWQGDFTRGEGDDPYYRRIYGAAAPLGVDFQETALTVLMPVIDHSIKGGGE